MNSEADIVQPPRIAVWLVNLFAPAEEAESILGDLLEEFSQLVSKSGVAFARNWYWQQTAATIAHLVVTGIRVAPFLILTAVAGGFLLARVGFPLYQSTLTAVLDKLGVYENHSGAFMFWVTYFMQIGHVAVAVLIGCIVALAARGKEMTATTTMAFIQGALAVIGVSFALVKTGHYPMLMLPWVFASEVAIIVGGAIVRSCRSVRTIRPFAAQ